VKYFLPDSQDLVDPSFDFVRETRSRSRVRQRDDVYAHELFREPPYDGLLVSKAIVDGHGGGLGRYTIAQRHRLLRVGVRDFFRVEKAGRKLETMGDCGAFSYAREKTPPFTVGDVIDFYVDGDFDYAISVDHVILGYRPQFDADLPGLDLVPEEWRERQEITFELAAEFKRMHASEGLRFVPLGVAQGWSPASYANAVKTLQKVGYQYIALGGLVPLKTAEIADVVRSVSDVRLPGTRFHLLGVTRLEHFELFEESGVASFDSTSPLRQAFKDDKDNYHTSAGAYAAVRVPQVGANPRIKKAILAGQIDQAVAVERERECLQLLSAYDKAAVDLETVLEALRRYEELYDATRDRTETNRRVLEDRPWNECGCDVCTSLGIHVVLFRGAERNRRRGLHNTFVFYQRLQAELAESSMAEAN
jgi:hypothetical protein